MCVSFEVTVFTPVTIIMPKTNDIKAGKIIILEFDMPAIFKAIISSDRTNLKKNMIDEIKKINGKVYISLRVPLKKLKLRVIKIKPRDL